MGQGRRSPGDQVRGLGTKLDLEVQMLRLSNEASGRIGIEIETKVTVDKICELREIFGKWNKWK